MLRTVAGVLVGYIATAVLVAVGLVASAFALGPDVVLEPGLYAPSLLYCAVGLGISFIGALLGGFVARKLGGTRTAVLVLALIVVGFGGAMAAGNLGKPAPEPAPRSPGEHDPIKLQSVREPAWLALSQPFVGAVGLLVGGRAWRR
jgi:hypothetical protein